MNLVEGFLLCTGGVVASYVLPVLLRRRQRPTPAPRPPSDAEIPWGPLRLWGPVTDETSGEDLPRIPVD